MNSSNDLLEKGKKNRWTKLSSVKRHDLYNFELKIDYKYTLEDNKPKKKKTSYLLDTYFLFHNHLK